jgi:hypothetical protein
MEKENSRVRITVLLDDETLRELRDYGYRENGKTNVSKAIMLMVRNNGKNNTQSEKQKNP